MYSSRTEGAALIQDAVLTGKSQKDILNCKFTLICFVFYLFIGFCLHLFEIWYRQQLLQSGKEFTDQSFQCCVEVRAILHWKHILSDENRQNEQESSASGE